MPSRANPPYWPRKNGAPTKRYFSRLTDERLCEIAAGVFTILDFRAVAIGEDVGHFQALTLRAPG